MSDDALKLAAPEANGTGTTGWIARMLGVSSQSIVKWVKAGMPTCGVDPRWGGPVYDLVVCRAWQAANRAATLHGGHRRGAGRKSEKPPAEMAPVMEAAAAKVDMRESALAMLGDLGRAATAEVAGTRIDFDNFSRLTETQLNTLAWLDPGISGWNAAQATRQQQMAKAQWDQMEIAKARGELMDRAEQAAALTTLAELVRANFEGLSGRLTPALMSAMRLTPDREAPLRALIDREVARVIAELERAGKRMEREERAAA